MGIKHATHDGTATYNKQSYHSLDVNKAEILLHPKENAQKISIILLYPLSNTYCWFNSHWDILNSYWIKNIFQMGRVKTKAGYSAEFPK